MIDRLRRFYANAIERYGPVGLTLLTGLTVVIVLLVRYLFVAERPLALGGRSAGSVEPSIHEKIATGVWWGDLIAAFVLLVLLSLGSFWARQLPESRQRVISRTKPGMVFFVLLVIAIIAGGIWRAPRLDHSLFNDEEMALRKYVMGYSEVDHETNEIVKFRPLKWERTLFYNLSGQNHTAQSILSRLSHDLWMNVADATPGEFSEGALRLPSYIASLWTIALVGFWLGRSGSPIGGLTAAWLLALHPWHIRYSVEARGYSLMLLAIVVAFFCLRPALYSARWRYWLGFGVAQTFILLSFAGALFLIVPLNLIIVILLIKNRDKEGAWRWIFVSVTGAMVVFFFLFPAVTNFMGWLESLNETQQVSEYVYLREFWSHLAFGVPWLPLNPDHEYGVGTMNLIGRGFWEKAVIFVVIPAMALIGASVSLAKSPITRVFALVMLFDIIFVDVYRNLTDTPFHVWYAVYVVLWFVIALASFAEIPEVIRFRKFPLTVRWALSIIVVACYAWITITPRQLMAEQPRHPMREAVVAARGVAPDVSSSSNLVTLAFGPGAKQLTSYDPRVISIKENAELQEKISECNATERNLTVYLIGPAYLTGETSELVRTLEDPFLFDEGEKIQGIEAFWSIQLFHLK